MGSTPRGWSNWARTVHAEPTEIARPRDAEQAAEVITSARRAGHTVRPSGSGHSFGAIAAPLATAERAGSVSLNLSRWTGITDVDRGNGTVTVRAGTTLRQLNADLDTLGLALPNLGDIDSQTVAGAIATGTHGTGSLFGGLATQVRGLELVLADGSTLRCDESENAELLDAARISLGALGLISTVTLGCVPAFALRADERPMPLDDVLADFDRIVANNDHAEFYWFPHGSHALVKRNNRLAEHETARPLHPLRSWLEYDVLENRLFGAVCRVGRRLPALVPSLNRLCGTTWSARSYGDTSHRVFVTSRDVRFVESEYAIDRERLGDLLDQLRQAARRLSDPVMFPVEVRVAAADSIWLSTAHGRDTAYVAVHQFTGMPYREWFDTFERLASEVGGRPHWGKMHRMSAEQLSERYPRFHDFRRVRRQLDPDGVFDSPHLRRVLDTRH